MVRSVETASATSREAERLADLVEEITKKAESGEPIDLIDYQRRFPALAEELEQVIPAILLLGSIDNSARCNNPHASSANSGLSKDSRLGDFRILRQIGRGGMGVVYEAEQISLRRRVALKVLPYAGILDPRQLARFRNETLAAAALKHPNIVSVYFVGCERSVHFYAMELVDGLSLADVIRQLHCEQSSSEPKAEPSDETTPVAARSTNFSTADHDYFRRVAELGVRAADALEYAHQMGIVHRDIKPSNLLVDARGNLFVTDFGLAQIGEDSSLTTSGDILGTLRYMSPEQAAGNRRILDHRTDIYSLGITLYELLTGKHAFDGSDRQKLLRKIAERAPRPPRSVNPIVPRDLETIVLKAVAKEPPARYAKMSELTDDLRRFLDDKPIHARRAGPTSRVFRWCRRNRLVASLLACLGLMVCATAYAMFRAWFSPATVYSPGSGIALRRVASGMIEAYRSVSPAGEYLSHINWATGNVAVIDLENGESRDVTSEGNWETATSQFGRGAVWSPDGGRIAYAWELHGANGLPARELRIINRDGTDQRTIYRKQDLRLLWLETWSADGKYILVKQILKDDSGRLALIATDDGAEQILISRPDLAATGATLSPDGKYVVYDARRADDNSLRNLYILNTRTAGEMPLVTNPADDWDPQWTPDGRWIVFLSDRRGTTDLWGLQVTNGQAVGTPYLIKTELARIITLGMTRGGSLYYYTDASRRDLYTAQVDFATLTVTSPVKALDTEFEGINLIGSWSADGKLAYLSRGASNRAQLRLTILDPETGRRQIPLRHPASAPFVTPSEMHWTADGTGIILRVHLWDPVFHYGNFDIRTGQIDPYFPEALKPRSATGISLSPDDQYVYFGGEDGIVRLEVATNRQLRLLDAPDKNNLAVSPDGQQLAFSTDRELRVMPANGGEPQDLFKPDARRIITFRTLDWLPDGDALIIGTQAEGDLQGPVTLWHVPLSEDDEPQKLAIQMGAIRHVRVHPDGKRIIFRASAGQSEVWAIDNVLATLNSTE